MAPPTPTTSPDVLNLEQLRAYLGGVSERSIHRWRHASPPLPAFKPGGRLMLFEKSAVIAWLRKHQEAPRLSTPRRLRRKTQASA